MNAAHLRRLNGYLAIKLKAESACGRSADAIINDALSKSGLRSVDISVPLQLLQEATVGRKAKTAARSKVATVSRENRRAEHTLL